MIAPSGPPENFEVKPLRGKGTAVIATWDPPEEPNGRIRGKARKIKLKLKMKFVVSQKELDQAMMNNINKQII